MAVAAEPHREIVSRCPMCSSERYAIAFEEGPYSVRRCAACGLGWTSPRLSAEGLEAMYRDDSYWRSQSPKTLGYSDYRAEEELYLKTFSKRLAFALSGGPRGGSALDIGCAAGFCMEAMRELGFEAHGVEVSRTIARHAIERLGFETVHIGPLETAPFEQASFDLITAWDVIEHVVDPGALLRRVRGLLKPGGLLVIETQNIDSRFARALGRRWHHYKHAEHIYHFTPRTLRTLLGDAGFDVQALTPRFAGKYVSLEFVAERVARINPALSRALAPLAKLASVNLYVNVMDEMIALARPAP